MGQTNNNRTTRKKTTNFAYFQCFLLFLCLCITQVEDLPTPSRLVAFQHVTALLVLQCFFTKPKDHFVSHSHLPSLFQFFSVLPTPRTLTWLIAFQPPRGFSISTGVLHTPSAPSLFLAFQSTIALQVRQRFYRPQAPFWLVDFRPPVFSRFFNCTHPNDPLLFGNYPTTWDYFRLLRISTDLKKIFLADRFLAAFLFCILSSVISP